LVSSAQDGWTASEHLLRIVPKEEQGHPGYIAAFLMTPYGQHQLTAKIYGGVVDELTEEDTRAVWIPNAPLEIQKEIGTRVGQAYEKKDQASVIEEKAIKRLEEYLTQR
jgi:restriction endonuclease S subunit